MEELSAQATPIGTGPFILLKKGGGGSRCGKDIFWSSVNKYGRREQKLFKKQSQIK